jgi:tetraacyldisaccharide 4'-kinase
LQAFAGGERRDLSCLRGARVGAFSGIATPESFEGFIREYGGRLLYTRRFLDHHRFSRDELDHIGRQAAEAGLDFLVTTEKDAVRIPADWEFALPLYYLRLEIVILSGVRDFEEAVSRICFQENLRAHSGPRPARTGHGGPETSAEAAAAARLQALPPAGRPGNGAR